MAALLQFEHGCRLSHLTFRFLQVTHDLEFNAVAPFVPFIPFVGGVARFALAEAESLGEWLLLWLRLFWGPAVGELVSPGETEKSVSSWDMIIEHSSELRATS